jgi:Zn-dependent protease
MDSRVYASPLFWSVVIGWILSVVLHEFAHGIVAYWGGDYTIRERGGLTLNPLQYVHPVNSILLPIIFLVMGGIPLPGGATYIRRDLIRNHWWDAACSIAGPAMNFLIFLCCALPLHPRWGWMHPMPGDPIEGAPAVLATMAMLQLLSMFINLLPLPPLDGFQTIAAFMDPHTRSKFFSQQALIMSTIILFLILWKSPYLIQRIYVMNHNVLLAMGFDGFTVDYFAQAFNSILYGV